METSGILGPKVIEHVAIPMRDGVTLAADIYFPITDHQKPWPVLLLRTPYDRRTADRRALAMRLAQDGYVTVVQDCRGRFGSSGQFSFLKHEPEDGYDTVEWIARQPWSNGRVGTFGTSYSASLQSAMATLSPPHLRAMWIHEGLANGLKESVRQGGAFELRWLSWALYGAATDPRLPDEIRQTLSQIDFRDWLQPFRTFAPGETPLALAPVHEAWADELLTTAREEGVWHHRAFNIEKYWNEHIDVPTMYSGGWYDSYSRATIRNYNGLSQRKRSPQYLLMGPWIHGWKEVGLSYAGMIDLGPDAALSLYDRMRNWFDVWLKDQETFSNRPVRYFEMGGGDGHRTPDGRLFHGGEWRETTSWPPPESRPTTFYLGPDGTLDRTLPDQDKAEWRFRFDPRHPVPTVGGNLSFLTYFDRHPSRWPDVSLFDQLLPVVPAGGFNQDMNLKPSKTGFTSVGLNRRPDILRFVSAPLVRPFILAGPITVRLFVESDRPDTDFTAKLIDWYPPTPAFPYGFALNLVDGIQRLRFRNGYETEARYEPGTITEIVIELYPTANRFQPGHRIRLDISSSNFPRFDVNPNTGEPIGRAKMAWVATNRIFMGRQFPSGMTCYGYEE